MFQLMLIGHGIFVWSLKHIETAPNQVPSTVRWIESEIKVYIVFIFAHCFPDNSELNPILNAMLDSHLEFFVLYNKAFISAKLKVVEVISEIKSWTGKSSQFRIIGNGVLPLNRLLWCFLFSCVIIWVFDFVLYGLVFVENFENFIGKGSDSLMHEDLTF